MTFVLINGCAHSAIVARPPLICQYRVNADTIRLLRAKGHDVKFRNAMGSLQSIMHKDGLYYGFSDPRRPGAKSVGVD